MQERRAPHQHVQVLHCHGDSLKFAWRHILYLFIHIYLYIFYLYIFIYTYFILICFNFVQVPSYISMLYKCKHRFNTANYTRSIPNPLYNIVHSNYSQFFYLRFYPYYTIAHFNIVTGLLSFPPFSP